MPRKKAELTEPAVSVEETVIQTGTDAMEFPISQPPLELPEAIVQDSPVLSSPEDIPSESQAPPSEPLAEPPAEPGTADVSADKQGTDDKPLKPETAVPPEPELAPKRRSTKKKTEKPESAAPADTEDELPAVPSPLKQPRPTRGRRTEPSILTIASGDEVDTPDAQEETAWHEIRNAHRTRRILTGTLSGLEPTETGKPIAIVNYNEYRVVIPLSEMMINLNEGPNNYGEMQLRQSKILGNMIGAEIDFVIKGIESKSRSIVASRKDAMMRKRKLFYFDTDSQGMYRIYEGRIVQARVIAVAEKVIRVEAFGAECPIMARDLSYNWLGDAHEYYNVGDEILIRVQQVNRESLETLSIRADVKSISGETDKDNLKKCRIQGKYAGTVTDIHRGVVFVRLNVGVNAVAHSCYDSRMPGKKDEVSFAVTHLDEERNVAVGIITRIMRRKI